MVDNRGITPISSFNFKSGDASAMANKMSEEKYGSEAEYFAQEMSEEQENKEAYQDRSAQLRASLKALAVKNAGSMLYMKIKDEEERKKKKDEGKKKNRNQETKEETTEESL